MLDHFTPLKTRIRRLARRFAESHGQPISCDGAADGMMVGTYHVPVLRAGSTILNLEHSACDRFTADTGATATIFVLNGDDLVRISTSVRNAAGERAVGTALDRSHPAYTCLLNRTSYIGYATLFGVQFMTAYDPLYDAQGQMIGARYVGLDVSAMHSITATTRTLGCMAGVNAVIFALLWAEPSSSLSREAILAQAALGACVLTPLLGWWLMRNSVQQPLRDTCAAAGRVGGGDLSAQVAVDRRDDIGQLLQAINGIGSGLADVVRRVRSASEAMHAAAEEVAAGTTDLSSRTQSQAASVEQTSAAMSQMTATVQQTAEHAGNANERVASAARLARESGSLVEALAERMNDIRDRSDRIQNIIGIIDGIAFQTNILALNAAVEAARAGEHGRGFSVVASEVRTLAQRSSDAAHDIKTLIGEAVDSVDAGNELVSSVSDNAQRTAHQVDESARLVDEIATASVQQSQGIEEVHQALSQMDEATQRNAALVEELEATATSMRENAGHLLQTVGTFQTADRASIAQSVTAIAPRRHRHPFGANEAPHDGSLQKLTA